MDLLNQSEPVGWNCKVSSTGVFNFTVLTTRLTIGPIGKNYFPSNF